MGKVIEFPARATTLDAILAGLAERIAAEHGASEADASFLETEARELRERYFVRGGYEFTFDIPDEASRYADEIHATVTDAMEAMRNEDLEDRLRMAAEILTLKLMLRGSVP